MTIQHIWPCLLPLALVASPLAAQMTGPVRMPGDNCNRSSIPSDPNLALTADQQKTLKCWYDAGMTDAGVRLAQSWLSQSPPDYRKAAKFLVQLARGTKASSSSLGALTGAARNMETMNLDSSGSPTPDVIHLASPVAQRMLAQLYLAGNGVAKDAKKAARFIKLAEKGGDAEAGTLHSEWLAKGLVVP